MTPALADRIAEAAAAEVQPRAHVQRLTAALDDAVGRQDYAQAQQLQGGLHEAGEALALAEATTAALRQCAQAVEAEHAATAQKIAAAADRTQATADLNQAVADDQHARQQLEAALGALYDAVGEAQRRLRAAQALEEAANRAAVAIVSARGRMGAWPAGHPGPAPARLNRIEALQDGDPLMRLLAGWHR